MSLRCEKATRLSGLSILALYGNPLLTFINYQDHMSDQSKNSHRVALMLQDAAGQVWSVSLSAHCLPFIGSYKRVDGFDIHAALRIEGVSRQA